jgi:hypothetical protein
LLGTERERIIYDPLYGYISVPSTIEQLLKTKEFQRLRYIRQLSFCYLAFPSANHTRFEHSLGVYNLIRQLMRVLQKEMVARKLNLSGKTETPDISDEHILEAEIGALLHDIGHTALGHTFEILAERRELPYDHEDFSANILRNSNSEVGTLLTEIAQKTGISIENVISMITEGESTALEYNFVGQLINSPCDMDRIDYLYRDAYYTGVGVSRPDFPAFIDSARVVAKLIDGKICCNIAFYSAAIPVLEGVLATRHHMFARVYHCLENRVAQHMLVRALEVLIDDGQLTPQDLAKMTDHQLIDKVSQHKDVHTIAERIQREDLHHTVLVVPYKSLSSDSRSHIGKRYADMSELCSLEKEIADKAGLYPWEVIIDIPKLVYIEAHVPIWDGKNLQSLSDVSDLAKSLSVTGFDKLICAVSNRNKIDIVRTIIQENFRI